VAGCAPQALIVLDFTINHLSGSFKKIHMDCERQAARFRLCSACAFCQQQALPRALFTQFCVSSASGSSAPQALVIYFLCMLCLLQVVLFRHCANPECAPLAISAALEHCSLTSRKRCQRVPF
jgi:hypothetical protein